MITTSVEQQVLYVLLTNHSAIAQCDLRADEFTTQTDSMVYQAMLDVSAENKPVDFITVAENLDDKHRSVDMAYLAELVEKGVGTLNNLSSYIEIIRKQARNRKARQVAYNLQSQIEAGDCVDPIGEAIRALMEIDSTRKNNSHHIREVMVAALDSVQAALDSEDMLGIPTGLHDLDDATGGYCKTNLYVVGARPAMGKTAFLLSSLVTASSARSGVISAEQSSEQVGQRLISIQGSVNSQNLRTANLDENEWSRVSGSVQVLQDRDIWVNDEGSILISELVRQAREWKFNHDIQILFVDYIQKIKGTNPKATKTEQVTEVVGALKNLAKELDIPVVALAQVKREVESRTDKRPNMADMSDASEIEKEADVIMTLYRDEVYNEDSPDKGIAEVDIVKNRHGPIGCVRCNFIGKYFQFKDFRKPSAA